MSIVNQLVKPASTAVAANHYSNLVNRKTTPVIIAGEVVKNGSMCPIFHWNAIWHHRVAVELCAQLFEDKEQTLAIFGDLKKYQKMYNRMYSTMPLRSNKSFSYYLGVVALDALLESAKNKQKHLKVFHNIITHLNGDGAFVEGSHYSIFCSQSFDRVYDLLSSYYRDTPLWLEVCESMEKLQQWQRRISNSEGVVASIGDSWYEKVEPTDEIGSFVYKDMTIHRNKRWTVVSNHRYSPWALHEHPHFDEVLISKDGEWIVQGSGMPSYKQVMAKPFRWRRPRNHFYIEKSFDYMFIWRIMKSRINFRNINIGSDAVQVVDKGYNTIRWPMAESFEYDKDKNIVTFSYKGADFVVSGDINNVSKGYAWQSTTYNNSVKVDVVRITGRNLITNVK